MGPREDLVFIFDEASLFLLLVNLEMYRFPLFFFKSKQN